MTGLLISLAFAALLACMPVGIRLLYNQQGGFVWLRLGFLTIPLYPRSKQTTKNKKKATTGQKTSEEKAGGSLKDFFPIVEIVLDFLSDFRRKLWVQNLELKLILAGDDPCDLALHYGNAWGVVGSLFPLLEQYVRIKNRNLQVECDFTATDTLVKAQAEILLSFGTFLWISLRHGLRGLKEYLHIMKKTKAV